MLSEPTPEDVPHCAVYSTVCLQAALRLTPAVWLNELFSTVRYHPAVKTELQICWHRELLLIRYRHTVISIILCVNKMHETSYGRMYSNILTVLSVDAWITADAFASYFAFSPSVDTSR